MPPRPHLGPLGVALLLTLTACAPPAAPTPGEAERYLHDRAFRRTVLEEALWQPDLPYARSLLSSYALPEGGWDLLPVAPFRVADAHALAAGAPLSLDGAVPPPPAAAPDGEGWRRLGAWVFERLPMRADGYLDWLAANPAAWPALGVTPNPDGTVRGLVRYQDASGRARVGMACAFCHAGDGRPGRGSRQLDLGEARARSAEARGQRPDPALRAWGPGRVDVTDAGLGNPTVIPGLWGLGEARWLNHSGVIQVIRRSTLAVRFETQYILGHRMTRRPPRALVWALASYVTALSPSAPPAPEGQALFATRCAGCHPAKQGFGGVLVPAARLSSDPAVATDPERGTGHYRSPRLISVAGNAPYLHDGSQPDLASLLAVHPQPGLPAAEQAALIDYLNTL